METKIKNATVKVMLSYDYSHFGASMSLENNNGLTKKEIDEARKDCQRLADKAVSQYKTAKQCAASATGDQGAASATGKETIAMAAGIEGKAKATKGNWIVVSEWKQDNECKWYRADVQATLVDGEKIKEDTYYELVSGKFTEA